MSKAEWIKQDGVWKLSLEGDYLQFDGECMVTADMADMATNTQFKAHAVDGERHIEEAFKIFCFNYPTWYHGQLGNSQDMVEYTWMAGIGLNLYGRMSGSDYGTFGGIRIKIDGFKNHGLLNTDGLREVRTVTVLPSSSAGTGGWVPAGNPLHLNVIRIKKYAPRPKSGSTEMEECDGFRREGEVGEQIIMEVVRENQLMYPLPERFSDIPADVLTEAELANVEWLGCSDNSIDLERNHGKYVTWHFDNPLNLGDVERLVLTFSMEHVENEADFKRKFRQKGKASLTNSGGGSWAGDEQARRGVLGFEILYAKFTDDDGSMFDEGSEISEYDNLKEGKEPMFVAAGNVRAVGVRLATNRYNAIEGENIASGWVLNHTPHQWWIGAINPTSASNLAYYYPLFIFNYDPPMKNRYLAREDVGAVVGVEHTPMFDDTAYTPMLDGVQMQRMEYLFSGEPEMVTLQTQGLEPDTIYRLKLSDREAEQVKLLVSGTVLS